MAPQRQRRQQQAQKQVLTNGRQKRAQLVGESQRLG